MGTEFTQTVFSPRSEKDIFSKLTNANDNQMDSSLPRQDSNTRNQVRRPQPLLLSRITSYPESPQDSQYSFFLRLRFLSVRCIFRRMYPFFWVTKIPPDIIFLIFLVIFGAVMIVLVAIRCMSSPNPSKIGTC